MKSKLVFCSSSLPGQSLSLSAVHSVRLFSQTAISAGIQRVFDHPFFVLLNVAVSGNFPGPPDAATQFPQDMMMIDYVRVFQTTFDPAPEINFGGMDAASYGGVPMLSMMSISPHEGQPAVVVSLPSIQNAGQRPCPDGSLILPRFAHTERPTSPWGLSPAEVYTPYVDST